jgi:Ca-activated chloride channel family protein
MFDTARRVKSVKSIAQMPVILGVRRSKAQALGWIGAKVRRPRTSLPPSRAAA